MGCDGAMCLESSRNPTRRLVDRFVRLGEASKELLGLADQELMFHVVDDESHFACKDSTRDFSPKRK
jgi:hypothetical protein